MSVNINNNGVLTKIAGKVKPEYGASTVRSGTVEFPATGSAHSSDATVTFADPMPDGNYIIVFHPTSGEYESRVMPNVYAQSASEFTARSYIIDNGTNKGAAAYKYTAFKLYTDTEYNQLLNLPAVVSALPQTTFITTDTKTGTGSNANDFHCGFVRTSDYFTSNMPTSHSSSAGAIWYDLTTVRQSNDPESDLWGYGYQIAVQTTTTSTQGDVYIRAVNGGSSAVWQTWRRLAYNYTSTGTATLNTTNASSGTATYIIKNGMCFVDVRGIVPKSSGTGKVVATGLPVNTSGADRMAMGCYQTGAPAGLFYVPNNTGNLLYHVQSSGVNVMAYATVIYPITD